MRFAIKTRPEHQTWAQMREVWLAALGSASDIDATVATAAAYRDAGADMAVLGLPTGAPPSLLDSLADRLAPLA